MSFKKTALNAIATLSLVVATLAFGAAPAVAAAPYTKWEDLKQDIEAASGTFTATLDQDLVATSSIKVPAGVTVKISGTGDSGVTIWSSPDAADFPMFDVTNSGSTLELGEKLTLSGMTMEPCGPVVPDPATYTFTAQKTLTGADLEEGMFYVQLYAYDTETDAETLLQTKTNAADGTVTFDPISFDEEGTFYYVLKEFQGSIPGMTYDTNEHTIPIHVTLAASGDHYEATPGTPMTPGFSNTYTAPSAPSNIGKLTAKNDNKLRFRVTMSGSSFVGQYSDSTFLNMELGTDGRLRAKYEDTSGHNYTYDVSAAVTATGAEAPNLGWGVSGVTTPVYVVKPTLNGGSFQVVTSWSNGDEVVLVTNTSDPSSAYVIGFPESYMVDTAHSWAEFSSASDKSSYIMTVSDVPSSSGDEGIPGETNPPDVTPTPDPGPDPDPDPGSSQPSQTCDEAQCGVYTSSTFSSGTADDPAAFFVKVGEGGEFKLSGATLRDFITDGTVFYAAPVVAKGGKVTISSGSITHNSVGYTAQNNLSGLVANRIGEQIMQPGNFGESGELGKWDNTEGAGAIILTEGASGTMSGGTISGNRADTGAVLVQGKPDKKASTENGDGSTSKFDITGGAIDNNVGIHHAGAIYVYNGADVRMNGGNITNNFSWNKGGAIWVSEEVYSSAVWAPKPGVASHIPVGKAVFVMDGGTISGNMTVNRGGAIEVMSDHVSLLNGFITNNYSRVLGGGIYVEGDGADRMYQVFIPKACITGNHAVPNRNTELSAPLYRTLHKDDPEKPCAFSNAMDGTTAGNVSAQGGGFANYYGHGGGIWMCAFGGNTTLTVAGDEVYVGGNDAEKAGGYSDLPGQDMLVRPKNRANTNGINVLSQGNLNNFKLQDGAGATLALGKHYDGSLALKNENDSGACPAEGIHMTGNVASNGGAIATNGSVILGNKKAGVYEALTTLRLEKIWSGELPKKDIILKIYVEVDGQRHPVDGYQVKLNGTQDSFVADSTQESLTDDQYNENTPAWEVEPWVTEFGIPTSVVIDGKTVPLFTFKNPDYPDDPTKNLDPSNLNDLETIHRLISEEVLTPADAIIGDWNLVIEEIDSETGEVLTQLVALDQHTLKTLEAKTAKETEFEDFGHHVVGTYGTYPIEFGFAGLLANDITTEIEKYVNQDVHADIVYFDQDFTYDIMAYVPLGATEFEITDTLVEALEFADADGQTAGDAASTIQQIAIKSENNHKVGDEGGTVVADPEDTIEVDDLSATVEGQKLTLSANDEDNPDVLEALQGKWVQVTFNARIKDDYRDLIEIMEMTGEDLSWAGFMVEKFAPGRPADNTNSNWPVISADPHEGILNKAEYTVKVRNGSEFSHDSNTVTVKPEVERYQADKLWLDVEGEEMSEWPTSDDGEPVVVTFELWRVNEKTGAEEKVAETEISDLETARYLDPEDEEKELLFPKLLDTRYEIREKVSGITSVIYGEPDVEIGLPKIEGDPASRTYAYTFTNKVEKPEIEKFVEKDVHKAIYYNDSFTYDVIAYVALDADKVTIYDTLVSDLVFESTEEDIVLVDLGTSVDHTPHGESVTAEGTPIEGFTATIDGQDLTVTIENSIDPETGKPIPDDPQPVTPLRGHWIKLTFDARLDPDKAARIEAGERAEDVLEYATIIDSDPEDRDEPNVGNDPVVSDEDHTGVPNKARYTMEVANEGKYEDESNTVTVKPEEPEIEKYVNQAVHKDIELDEVFTYDVIAYVTLDADKVVITDTLLENLEFVSSASEVTVEDLGTENNHKPAYDVSAALANDDATVAASGEAIPSAKKEISGKTLTVTIEDATDFRGHWVRVSFDARIPAGTKLEAVKVAYKDVAANSVYNDPVSGGKRAMPNVGNAPVLSDEDHTGLPNTASYKIYVKNEAGVYDERYEDTSNTVTVKPVDDDDVSPDRDKPKRKRTPKTGDTTSYVPIGIALGGAAVALGIAWKLRKDDSD